MANTTLSDAVIRGDTVSVRNLLRNWSINVNVPGQSGLVPLHHAAEENDEEILRLLMQQKRIDVNARDSLQRTPLHIACGQGFSNFVKRLLEVGEENSNLLVELDVNALATGDITPLHLAVQSRDCYQTVKILVDHQNIDLVIPTREEGFTAMHLSASSGNRKVMELLIKADYLAESQCQIIRAKDVYERVPLHYAVWNNNVDAVQYLLGLHSVEVNASDRDGFTALHFASLRGHVRMVELLLGNEDIVVNVASTSSNQNTRGDIKSRQLNVDWEKLPRPKLIDFDFTVDCVQATTPLHLAVEQGHEDVVSILLGRNDVEVLLENSDRNSALEIAVRTKRMSILKKLLKRKWPDIDELERWGELLLHVARKEGTQQIGELSGVTSKSVLDIIEHEVGNPVKARFPSKDGIMTIHNVAYAGHDGLLKFMVKIPTVDVNAEDSDQQTPLYFATLQGKFEVVKVLIETKKLRANTVDKFGRTALLVAVKNKKKDIERLLLELPEVKGYVDGLYRDRQVYVDAANAILVGAALIASVTFAGWLQPPLSYTYYYEFPVSAPDGSSASFEQYAGVQQHIGLRVFWVFNSLSFFFAIAAVIAGVGSVLPMMDVIIGEEVKTLRRSLMRTSIFMVLAVVFALGAFGAAGFTSLPPSFA